MILIVASAGLLLASGIAGARCCSDDIGSNVRVVRAGSLTLITHRPTGVSADALLSGRLGTNTAGCITVNGAVVVLPFGSTLTRNGTVTVAAGAAADAIPHPVHQGDPVSLGGGAADPPAETQTCGRHARYFWAG